MKYDFSFVFKNKQNNVTFTLFVLFLIFVVVFNDARSWSVWKVESDTDEMLAPAKMASSAFEVDGYKELTEVTVFWMFDEEGTLTESSKSMWVQLDVAGWFRLLSAFFIRRWWLKDADLYGLKLMAAQLHFVVFGKIGVK